MLEFISENLATIAVAAIVAAVVVLIIVKLVKDHKNGVGSCSCGSACAGCPNAAMCHTHMNAPKGRR